MPVFYLVQGSDSDTEHYEYGVYAPRVRRLEYGVTRAQKGDPGYTRYKNGVDTAAMQQPSLGPALAGSGCRRKQSKEDGSILVALRASTNYKEAFSLFDKRGNGRVTLDSLGDLLRACGQNPTLSEIRDLEKNVGGDFDFETFQRILNRPGGFRDPGEPDEYCRGFQVFDKDMTGYIGVGQLKYILTNLGEKMTDEEVDELLKAVDTSTGQVNYTDLVRTILAN
ncbi:myosin regulatory light chain cdc4 [Grosmannia clavigera kw1407]|uniref:Calmodulin n=1 Tax=Grosmannia clavigera (strain kw1407 / UAMH 11150) TaxID=655863 RepID=F0X857_GROCL|nr:myosin regulatory light chain cdc4 [Grosmannia clavigera kw1407]EFX05533.1 myosin regulatory light chain cdc4 [Grosmannia clavigera kw1407]